MLPWKIVSKWTLDIIWFFILLLLFAHFWKKRKNLVSARSWLITKGQLTKCEWTKIGNSIWPKIEYTYQIYDKDWFGEYLFLDTTHNNPNSKYARNIAYKVAVAFIEEREIDVYYNPCHPAQSALDISIPTKLNGILMLLGLLIIIHLAVIVSHFF